MFLCITLFLNGFSKFEFEKYVAILLNFYFLQAMPACLRTIHSTGTQVVVPWLNNQLHDTSYALYKYYE